MEENKSWAQEAVLKDSESSACQKWTDSGPGSLGDQFSRPELRLSSGVKVRGWSEDAAW